MSHTQTREELIADISCKRPHVFLLGAGASRAACPTGDKNGKRLPVMNDFIDIVPIRDLLDEASIEYEGRNFEELYSELHADSNKEELRIDLENRIYNYFLSLELPSEPTIYDYIVLGLRPKDVIATFNWDPFLIQAIKRNLPFVKHPPRLLFLHGNVLSGFCEQDKLHGEWGATCPKCGAYLKASKLLFPILSKNYESEPAIKDAWDSAKRAFSDAFMLTIFGYGAPKTDIAAITLLHDAWQLRGAREFEEIEIIDLKEESELVENWNKFIFSHHYRVKSDFFESLLTGTPRRTGEAWWTQFLEGKFIEPNPVPRFSQLHELWDWFSKVVEWEER